MTGHMDRIANETKKTQMAIIQTLQVKIAK